MRPNSNSLQSGVTLVEILLVLGIGAAIVVMGIRQYQSMKYDADIQQAIANVDKLFQSGALYYMSNCKRQWDPAAGPIAGTGTLDPANNPLNPFSVTVSDLTTAGYFDDLLSFTPIVNNSSAEPGYVVQFNMLEPPNDREMTVSGQATPARLGEIIHYTVQVSILLRDPVQARLYRNSLGADCLSSLTNHGGGEAYVIPCKQVTVPPTFSAGEKIYAVFERLPSFAVPRSQSGFWVSMPDIKLFNQLYETNDPNYLSKIDPGNYPQQYYLCGS